MRWDIILSLTIIKSVNVVNVLYCNVTNSYMKCHPFQTDLNCILHKIGTICTSNANKKHCNMQLLAFDIWIIKSQGNIFNIILFQNNKIIIPNFSPKSCNWCIFLCILIIDTRRYYKDTLYIYIISHFKFVFKKKYIYTWTYIYRIMTKGQRSKWNLV